MSSWTNFTQNMQYHPMDAAAATPSPLTFSLRCDGSRAEQQQQQQPSASLNNNNITSCLSTMSHETDFSACQVFDQHTDDISPSSHGFLLSEDVTVGALSPATTAMTSLLQPPGLNNSVTMTTTTTITTTAATTPTIVATTNASASAAGYGAVNEAMDNAMSEQFFTTTGTRADISVTPLSVLHCAVAAATDLPSLPQAPSEAEAAAAAAAAAMDTRPEVTTLAKSVSSKDIPQPNSTDDEAEADIQTAVGRDGSETHVHCSRGHRSTSATAAARHHQHHCHDHCDLQPGSLQVHWCCPAHWRAARRMERGVQAPAAVTMGETEEDGDGRGGAAVAMRDVYCVLAQAKRPRRDEGSDGDVATPRPARVSETTIHLCPRHRSKIAAAQLAVRSLPPSVAVSVPSAAAPLPRCEFCGKAVALLRDDDDETTDEKVRCGTAPPAKAVARDDDTADASPTKLRRLRGRAGVLSSSSSSVSPRKAAQPRIAASNASMHGSCTTSGGVSTRMPLSSLDSSASLDGAEAGACAACSSSLRDAAMLAAVTML